jgi:hypothetical protein
MTAHRRITALIGFLAVAVAVGACASSANAPSPAGPAFREAGAPAQMPAASAAAPAAAPNDLMQPSTTGANTGEGGVTGENVGGGSTGSTGSDGTAALVADQALIVKTGSMVLDVTDLDAALLRAQAAIVGLGGYVSASDRTASSDQPLASVTYRIPAARWDDALAALRTLATKIEKEQTNTVEVTGQVLDLGARIANLQATEQALQAIMQKATKIPDILEVQNQLTTVQGQIEELTTEKSHLEQQAALSTLTVVFQVPAVAVTAATKGWNPGAQVDEASARLIELGQAVASVLIWAGIVGLPVVLVLLIVLVPCWWLLRRLAARVRPSPGARGGMWGGGEATPTA